MPIATPSRKWSYAQYCSARMLLKVEGLGDIS
jgi:hypothetical protein